MGRRHSFELLYPVGQVPVALDALTAILTPAHRKRAPDQVRTLPWDLSCLTPDAPLFAEVSVLFAADEVIRAYHGFDEVEPEWTDDGAECLPVGIIGLAARVGTRYAALTFTAATSRMSDLFRDSPAVWERFAALLRSSGGLVGLFSGADHRGCARYPLLPDGRELVELDYFNFVVEERDTYWHIDTDRYVEAVLRAPRVTGRTVRGTGPI